jgi:succinate dehydrogenase / fumarate reductase, membrane anchor subunit
MSDSLQTHLKRVKGSGSAKSGTHHWMLQRLTAIALIFLLTWFLVTISPLGHADYANHQLIIRNPLVLLGMVLFVVTMLLHAKLGVQVVLEDYVHKKCILISSLVILNLAIFALIGAALLAAVKLLTNGDML